MNRLPNSGEEVKTRDHPVDQGCYDLAGRFIRSGAGLPGEPLDTLKNHKGLAVAIQMAIEDWYQSEEVQR